MTKTRQGKTAPLPIDETRNMNRKQLFTLIRLQLGPLPFPSHPDYDQWYGGGFGTDMLGDEVVREHSKNQAWRQQAEILVAWHSNRLTMNQVRETVSALWDEERKNAAE